MQSQLVITLMWIGNLFSLFSSFGALVITVFIAARSRKREFWQFLGILSLYVAAYAQGIFQFIFTSGLERPQLDISLVMPAGPTPAYIVGSVVYVLLCWLIPSTTSRLLGVGSRRAYLVLLPFAVAGIVLPDALLFFSPEFLAANVVAFVVLRLLMQIVLLEYPVILVMANRSRLPEQLRKVLTVMAAVMAIVVVPAMLVEELLVLFAGIWFYNFTDIVGFLFLTTGTLIVGIYYLTTSSRTRIEAVPLIDVARLYGLTERETEVMKELVAGGRYKEIGSKLNISTETVKTHVSRVYRKLDVSAKQELKYKIRDFLS